eukprot:gene3281-54378_t
MSAALGVLVFLRHDDAWWSADLPRGATVHDVAEEVHRARGITHCRLFHQRAAAAAGGGARRRR